MAGLIQNLTEMARLFGDVATTDPVSALLLLVGALLVGFSSLLFGYLALGGIGAALIPDTSPKRPQQRG